MSIYTQKLTYGDRIVYNWLSFLRYRSDKFVYL